MLDCLIDGRPGRQVEVDSRALNYADGVFETMRRCRGRLPFWPWHQARLRFGLAATGLHQPDWGELEKALEQLAPGAADCVVKLLVTACSTGRGYGRAWPAAVSWVLSAHPLPSTQPSLRAGLSCEALGRAPSPQGLKRLALTAQVRAQSLAERVGHDTALIRDRLGRPVSFSQGSLLARHGECWLTPPLAHGALAGVTRAWLLSQTDVVAAVKPLTMENLLSADEVLFCNAVRGPVPVIELDARRLPQGLRGPALMRRWLLLLNQPIVALSDAGASALRPS